MKIYPIILTCISLFCCNIDRTKNNNNNELSEREFTELYMDSLKIRFPDIQLQIIDSLGIDVTLSDSEYKLFLDNAYRDYLQAPDSIGQVISKYISKTSYLFTSETHVIPEHLVPVIKNIDYLDHISRLGMDSSVNFNHIKPLYQSYNDELIIVFGEDNENGVMYLTDSAFSNLSIGRDTLLSFSIENLWELIPEITTNNDEGYYIVFADGVYESSLIVITEIWTQGNFNVKGDFVIGIPARDLLYVTGSQEKKVIDNLRVKVAEEYHTKEYSISPELFRWNGNKFLKY